MAVMNVGASRYLARACNFSFADSTFCFLHKRLLKSPLDNALRQARRVPDA
jgi:hypothetical protein